jgi:hypothetical protein
VRNWRWVVGIRKNGRKQNKEETEERQGETTEK